VVYHEMCPGCGVLFTYTVSGDYYPATREDPAAYPEVEVLDRECDDECTVTNERLVAHVEQGMGYR
jgi:hypothetical protein